MGTIRLSSGEKTQAVQDFLSYFEAQSTLNPMSRDRVFHNTRIHCSAGLSPNSIHIHSMEAMERGAGADALDALNKIADQFGVTLTCTALPYREDHGITMQSLLRFYVKHGFVKTGVGDEQSGFRMVREPKKKLKLGADNHIVKLAGFKKRPH